VGVPAVARYNAHERTAKQEPVMATGNRRLERKDKTDQVEASAKNTGEKVEDKLR
jgi:hypothetical protein